jgi:hypothetical protein
MAVGCGIAALMVYAGFGFFWPLTLGAAGSVLGYFVLVRVMKDVD